MIILNDRVEHSCVERAIVNQYYDIGLPADGLELSHLGVESGCRYISVRQR